MHFVQFRKSGAVGPRDTDEEEEWEEQPGGSEEEGDDDVLVVSQEPIGETSSSFHAGFWNI